MGLAVVMLVLLVSSCSEHVPRPEVGIRLDDYSMEVSPDAADEGIVKMFVDNQSGQKHELLLIRARAAADLPLRTDGSVDYDRVQIGDRLEAVGPGRYRI